MRLKLDMTETERKLLLLDGLPGYMLKAHPFYLEDLVVGYVSASETFKPLPLKRDQMLSEYNHCYDEPLHNPYTLCISSEVNDSRAKLAAATLMLKAHRDGAKCVWHNIYGGYKDDMRDNPKSHTRVKFLVLSNVPTDATPNKMEKLRDILEMYSNIPRIVVTTGQEPIQFFQRLGLPINYALRIMSTRSKRVMS